MSGAEREKIMGEHGDRTRKKPKLAPSHVDSVIARQNRDSADERYPESKTSEDMSQDRSGNDILQKYRIRGAKSSSSNARGEISPPPSRRKRVRAATSQAHASSIGLTEVGNKLHGGASNNVELRNTSPDENPLSAIDNPMLDIGSDQMVHNHPRPPEPLNPRPLLSSPASHAVRLKLCNLLHEQYTRLNNSLIAGDHPNKLALLLSPPDIITKVLDEEELTAKSHPSIYTNVLRSRISALKKMLGSEWERHMDHVYLAKQAGAAKHEEDDPKHVIRTGLSAPEEKSFLKYLAADSSVLAQYNYITAAPSQSEFQRASDGIQASHGHEICERCSTRFQVFPGRRPEDGALTTGGHCLYHSGKARQKDRNSPYIYTCCSEEVGTGAGCTTANSHVFKSINPACLATVLDFVETPKRKKLLTKCYKGIALDCEMGFTTKGFEATRITAVAFPTGDVLIDALVRPQGEILDLNSTYSGVYAADFANAIPLDEHITTVSRAYEKAVGRIGRMSTSAMTGGSKEPIHLPKPPLPLCTSIDQARRLLFTHISPATAIIGHGLENDLRALRIIHPIVIDTAILFPKDPSPDQVGQPLYRYSLKVLMWQALRRNIQMSRSGHDSCEDARSAMELVRYYIMSEWKKRREQGWVIEDGKFRDPARDSDTASSSSGSE